MVDRHEGGVRIFVNSSIKHTSSVFLEIEQPHQRKRIVGVIYRPPETDPAKTISKMSELLAKISKEPKSCYLFVTF